MKNDAKALSHGSVESWRNSIVVAEADRSDGRRMHRNILINRALKSGENEIISDYTGVELRRR